jgi:hypothetical protein
MTVPDMRRKRHIPGTSPWIGTEYPRELIDMARGRVEGLLHSNITGSTTILKLLESAYIQGVEDGMVAAQRLDCKTQ